MRFPGNNNDDTQTTGVHSVMVPGINFIPMGGRNTSLVKVIKLTPQMLAMMSPEDRCRYTGEPLPEPVKAVSQKVTKLEKDEHKTFINWLNLHNYQCVRHARTDKRTTEPLGVPDFSVYDKVRPYCNRTPVAQALLFEFKLPGNKLTLQQELWHSHCGGIVHVVHTADEAIALILEHFGP